MESGEPSDQTSHNSASGSLAHVVGVGDSAGGLEALQQLFAPLIPDMMTAFVVAQHLAPDHPSLIVELLSHGTALRVVEALDGAQLEPGVVVIGPPDRDITVDGDRICLKEPAERLGPSPNVDLLFESLANAWGNRSVAIILSGTGSDGAHGMNVVKGVGGITIVQKPESARFDGMPRAALAMGGVDLVADADEIGEQLVALMHDTWSVGDSVAIPDSALPIATTRLKNSVGMDFSGFKESTLRRQLQRRMAARQSPDTDSYLGKR